MVGGRTSGGIHYLTPRDADTSKPLVLMCHGVWERGRWWTGWFPALGERFCPVAIDVPGYGDSPARARDTLSDWADVLIEVMDELGAERAYLAGSATGGAACLAAAHEHPDRIAAVVACNTPFNGANLSETVGRFDQLYGREGQQGLVDYMLPLLGLEVASTDLADDVRRTYERCNMDVVLPDAGIWGRTDLTRDLPEIGCPVLILAPGASPLISTESSIELAGLLPNSILVIFEQSGSYLAYAESPLSSGAARWFLEYQEAAAG